MAGGAAGRGLPLELPVMAGLAESGLRNLRGPSLRRLLRHEPALNEAITAASRATRPPAPLVPRHGRDRAPTARGRGRPDPAADRARTAIWVADIERPAPENRVGYQKYLDRRASWSAAGAARRRRIEPDPPRLRVRIVEASQTARWRRGVGIAARALPGGGAASGRDGRRRASACARRRRREPARAASRALTVAVHARVRRALREGDAVQAVVRRLRRRRGRQRDHPPPRCNT